MDASHNAPGDRQEAGESRCVECSTDDLSSALRRDIHNRPKASLHRAIEIERWSSRGADSPWRFSMPQWTELEVSESCPCGQGIEMLRAYAGSRTMHFRPVSIFAIVIRGGVGGILLDVFKTSARVSL